MPDASPSHSLGEKAAFQLANVTKTPPQYQAITPRWLVRLLDWKPLEAGTLRVNRVVDEKSVEVVCDHQDEKLLPESFVNYEEKPREYTLNSISAVVDVRTTVSDLFSNPFDQIREQLRLTIETVKERQENELINNNGYGLLKNVPASQRIQTRTGPPTPDDLDELIAKVWKEPSFFLAHPRAIAAFGRECTRRGVPPPTVTLFGSPFLTWRHPDHPLRQVACGRSGEVEVAGREDQHPAPPRRREEAGRDRVVSTGASGRADAGVVRAVHGHQPEVGRFVPRAAVLLRSGIDGRRDRRTR